MGVNKVILVGHVGKDPEIKTVGNDTKMASFSLATSETYKKKDGERVTNTEWHNITIWRGLANVVERFVKKGSQLYLEGKIENRSYDDKDGNKKYITQIKCHEMQMLDNKGGSNGESADNSKPQTSTGNTNQSEKPDSDDLPF